MGWWATFFDFNKWKIETVASIVGLDSLSREFFFCGGAGEVIFVTIQTSLLFGLQSNTPKSKWSKFEKVIVITVCCLCYALFWKILLAQE